MTVPLLPSPICKTSTRPSRRTSAAAFRADPPDADDPLLSFAPYIHKAPRRNSITPERQRMFVAALAASGIVTQAARTIGVSLEALYALRHRKGAEGFSAAWEQALDRGVARLEDCALERAIQGEERVFFNRSGEVAGRWRRYDTPLILFLLRQRRAERFGGGYGDFTALKPGHPVYDRLHRQWAQRDNENTDEIIASINRKIDLMRERSIAAGEYYDDDDDGDDPAETDAATEDRMEAKAEPEPATLPVYQRAVPRVITFD